MKILYITTISLTMNSFFKPHVEMLVSEGHQLDIACNADGQPLDSLYNELHCRFYQVDFSRSPLSPDNVKAYKQLHKIIKNGSYDIVHCHTPNASVITRLVCRKYRKRNGLKVFYTAHGFHFYKGAPLKNWMLYYPIEKLCSRFTDKLITINREDYALAQKKFKAKKVCYVPGVGIDLSRFQNIQVDRNAKRQEIGVPKNCFLLLSVGELNDNKNHQIIIRAMAQLNDLNIHYAIAGTGNQKEPLLRLAKELGFPAQIHFLGYRTDAALLYRTADLYVLPSVREGLNVSIMEAMASGLSIVCSRIRGNSDLIDKDGGALFDPRSVTECREAIKTVIDADRNRMGQSNQQKVKAFSTTNVIREIRKLYEIF